MINKSNFSQKLLDHMSFSSFYLILMFLNFLILSLFLRHLTLLHSSHQIFNQPTTIFNTPLTQTSYHILTYTKISTLTAFRCCAVVLTS